VARVVGQGQEQGRNIASLLRRLHIDKRIAMLVDLNAHSALLTQLRKGEVDVDQSLGERRVSRAASEICDRESCKIQCWTRAGNMLSLDTR